MGRPRYRWRTRLRRRLPRALVNAGIAAKGRDDCGEHEWYVSSDDEDRCYHCEAGVRRPRRFPAAIPGTPDPDSLVAAVVALSEHFSAYSDERAAVSRVLDGPREELSRRVLSLFTHGMGGLMDAPIYRVGPVAVGQRRDVDADATARRDELCEQLYRVARGDLR